MLLLNTDPAPFTMNNPFSQSPFIIVCDHAGFLFPSQLSNLGVDDKDRYRHIAWDIGIKGVGKKLSTLLDIPFIAQTYSRLIIDCNRREDNPTLITEKSDDVIIQGNKNLTQEEKQSRVCEIYLPYHQAISNLLDDRLNKQLSTIFLSLHSFTPIMNDGFQRPWHAGVLHGKNNQFSMIFKKILEKNYPYPIGDNQPYALIEKNDYTVPTHAYKRNLPYLELEIRQDLINTEIQQQEWAERLSILLLKTLKEYQLTCN